MLYKNLPEEELTRVLSVRYLLDFVAALKFLLTGSLSECKAVFEAHREFFRMKRMFKAQRRENIAGMLVKRIPERAGYSILWRYYVKGIRKFEQFI